MAHQHHVLSIWEEVLVVLAQSYVNSIVGGSRTCSHSELTQVLLPLPLQAPLAAESHPGFLPAGEPAQHGERVHPHLRDL